MSKISKPGLAIPPENPFENDKLGREGLADNLTCLISTYKTPFVLNINSRYGSGKTTFIDMWRKKVEGEFHCIHFNAWESDHSQDPLVSFIGEIGESLDQLSSEEEGELKTKLGRAFEISGSIARSAIPLLTKIFFKLATHGLFDGDIDKLSLEDDIADYASEIAEKRIDEYKASKESIKNFKALLEEFAKEVSSDDKPVLFFIDELDRCRPDYAVQLLERIKHLFNVPGFVFILASDREQLAHSVKALYGQGMDADGYLRRFIDLDFTFPLPSLEQYCAYLEEFYQLSSLHTEYNIDQLRDVFLKFYSAGMPDLREVQVVYMRTQIALSQLAKQVGFRFAPLVMVLMAIRLRAPDEYEKIRAYSVNLSHILDQINLLLSPENISNADYYPVLLGYLQFSFDDEHRINNALNQFRANRPSYSRNENDIKKRNTHGIIAHESKSSVLGHGKRKRNENSTIARVIDAIEFSSSFQ